MSELGDHEDMITPDQLGSIITDPLVQVLLKLVSGVVTIWLAVKRFFAMITKTGVTATVSSISGAYIPS